MLCQQIVGLWEGIGIPTTASRFEQIVSAPNRKLAGFHLRDREWPIFDPEELESKNLFVLDESQVKEIYLALGGDRQKAVQMFPTIEKPISQ